MANPIEVFESLTDTAADLLEKISTPGSRAGSTVERVGKMLEEDVDLEVIALQMTKNSATATPYTVDDVMAYGHLYQDSKTRAPVTAAQTRALIKDQRDQKQPDVVPVGVGGEHHKRLIA